MTAPFVIQQQGFGDSIAGGLGPLLQALQQRRQTERQIAQDEMQRERLDLERQRLEAALGQQESARAVSEIIGQQILSMMAPPPSATAQAPRITPQTPKHKASAITRKPSATTTGAMASPQDALRDALTQVAGIDPAAVPDAARILTPIAQSRQQQLDAAEADRTFQGALASITDPTLRNALSLQRAFQLSGVPVEIQGQAVRDLLAQGRLDTGRIGALRADPRFAPLARLPDEQFLPAVARVLEEQTKDALGIGMPQGETREEYILKHMLRVTLPQTSAFGVATPPLFESLEEARNALGARYDAAMQQRRAVRSDPNMRTFRRPLADTEHESMARVLAEQVGTMEGATIEDIRALIQQAAPNISPRDVQQILLRMSVLRETPSP